MRAIHILKTSKNYTCLLEGLSPIHSKCWRQAQGLMWGARGPFPLVMAMVVAVVTPVVFVLWLLKNSIKTLKLVVCKLILYNLPCIEKPIAIHVRLIVSWPEPEPLWSNGTPAYWVSPESSCHGENNKHMLLRPQCRNTSKKKKRLTTSYLRLLIILDFWLFSECFLCPGVSYAPGFTVVIVSYAVSHYTGSKTLTYVE